MSKFKIPLLLIALACGWISASAQSNAIENLLTTNQPGQYTISPIWVGETKTTAATGYFANRPFTLLRNRSEYELRFDLFSVLTNSPWNHWGSHVISQSGGLTAQGWGHSNLHSYRDSFPTDLQMLQAFKLSELTKLLGPSQGFSDAWGDPEGLRSTVAWSFFRLKETNTVETLSVFGFTIRTNRQVVTYVDSIRIRRGTAKPAK